MIDKNAIGQEPKAVKIYDKIKKIFNIFFSTIFIIIIFINLILIIQTFIQTDKAPNFLGYKCFVITSGSMEPTIHVGDFIIVKESKKEDINKEDIITFRSGKIVITHRIVNIKDKDANMEIITKGDNNNTEDDTIVKESEIEGKYLFTIPVLGKIVLWSQTTVGLATLIIIPVLVCTALFWKNQRAKTKQLEREKKRIKYKK